MLPNPLLPIACSVPSPGDLPGIDSCGWATKEMASLPSLAFSYSISWGFHFAPYGLYWGQTDWHQKFHTSGGRCNHNSCTFLQLAFTVSANPGNSFCTSCVKTQHQVWAPSIMSLWVVECSIFNKMLQAPTSLSGRKEWEVWGLLVDCKPSPPGPAPSLTWAVQGHNIAQYHRDTTLKASNTEHLSSWLVLNPKNLWLHYW